MLRFQRNWTLLIKVKILKTHLQHLIRLHNYRLLTGLKITNLQDVNEMLDRLHQMGPQTVVLTSCSLKHECNGNYIENKENTKSITTFASKIIGCFYNVFLIIMKYVSSSS